MYKIVLSACILVCCGSARGQDTALDQIQRFQRSVSRSVSRMTPKEIESNRQAYAARLQLERDMIARARWAKKHPAAAIARKHPIKGTEPRKARASRPVLPLVLLPLRP